MVELVSTDLLRPHNALTMLITVAPSSVDSPCNPFDSHHVQVARGATPIRGSGVGWLEAGGPRGGAGVVLLWRALRPLGWTTEPRAARRRAEQVLRDKAHPSPVLLAPGNPCAPCGS